jgi:hypothetical protein
VSGPNGYDDYAREVSNVVCFPVDTPPPPLPPPPPPPPPPCCLEETTTTTTKTPPTTTTTVPEEEAEPYTESVRFEQEAPPPVPPAPSVLSQDVLPRTGADAGVGARLAAGALALAILSGRLRRRAQP